RPARPGGAHAHAAGGAGAAQGRARGHGPARGRAAAGRGGRDGGPAPRAVSAAGPAASFPEWLEPMAARLTQERFAGPEWSFERKLDGIRLLAFKSGGDVRLLSRTRLPLGYPSVGRAIAELPVHDVVLDGEAAWDPESRVAYHVFDVLLLEGRLLTAR